MVSKDKRKNRLEKTEKNSKLGFVFPKYNTADYFIFRHVGGVPTEIIWPAFPDQSKFICGIPNSGVNNGVNAGVTRFILPSK
jgi:hypothetical protein